MALQSPTDILYPLWSAHRRRCWQFPLKTAKQMCGLRACATAVIIQGSIQTLGDSQSMKRSFRLQRGLWFCSGQLVWHSLHISHFLADTNILLELQLVFADTEIFLGFPWLGHIFFRHSSRSLPWPASSWFWWHLYNCSNTACNAECVHIWSITHCYLLQ